MGNNRRVTPKESCSWGWLKKRVILLLKYKCRLIHVEIKLNDFYTYLRLRAFSRSEFIRFAFNFLSSFVSTAMQSESGPSSNCSPVSVSAAPSTLLTTASKMSGCLFPLSSWYLWWIRLTYLPQWFPFTTMRIPLSRVGLGFFGETHAGAKPFEVL